MANLVSLLRRTFYEVEQISCIYNISIVLVLASSLIRMPWSNVCPWYLSYILTSCFHLLLLSMKNVIPASIAVMPVASCFRVYICWIWIMHLNLEVRCPIFACPSWYCVLFLILHWHFEIRAARLWRISLTSRFAASLLQQFLQTWVSTAVVFDHIWVVPLYLQPHVDGGSQH